MFFDNKLTRGALIEHTLVKTFCFSENDVKLLVMILYLLNYQKQLEWWILFQYLFVQATWNGGNQKWNESWSKLEYKYTIPTCIREWLRFGDFSLNLLFKP